MATLKRVPRGKLRGQNASTRSLDDVVQKTFYLWRKHHLGYDQTKYVVERVRRRLALAPPRLRNRTVARLDSGLVPIDQVQKFLGYLHLSITQIYNKQTMRALGDNYIRAPGGKR